MVLVAHRAPTQTILRIRVACDAHHIPASPGREFKVGFVLFRSQYEVGAEFGTAFGNEAFDQTRLTFGQEFLHFFEGEFFFTEFLGDLEDGAIFLIGLAHIVGSVELHDFAVMQGAFPERLGLGKIWRCFGFADDRFTILADTGLTGRELPRDPSIVTLDIGVEGTTFFGDETLDQSGLSFGN